MLREPLRDRASGRWRGILLALGLPSKALTNRHGPCPICGGKDRFRFDDKSGRGTWICSKCGAGDGIELVKLFHRVEFREAARLIEQHVDEATIIGIGRQPQPDGQKREEMIALWKRSNAITVEDCAGRYLHERCGLTTFPANVRFSPDERYVESGSRPTYHPVMVAKVDPSDAAVALGERAALHRTYLSPLGGKADVASPRKMLGAMPAGAAVRLMSHDTTLGIAEGIETALSAASLFGVPTWAALTAGLMQDWVPPPNVTTVMIFGDNDDSGTGQEAAYILARRLKAKGLAAFVELPARAGHDWNDVLMSSNASKHGCSLARTLGEHQLNGS